MKNTIIEADNVSYKYGTDDENRQSSPAVKDLDIKINDGEFVAVIGRNGSGKSTFARLLNALLIPTSGVLYITNRR
ncbi:MAG TPA: ATP-binding cassette domain-containing protein, partial [Acetivibrio sp.]|nr:ATP-binding cassette domain-containing protein [Acetivibrio sp.]